jgi:hypothetical protein
MLFCDMQETDSVFSSQMMVNGSEFRLIQLPCFLLTAQFNSLHPWTGRNSSQLGTPQISFHWWNTTNSQRSECTEHIIMVSRESSCNNCIEFAVGLKILLHYSFNGSHRCQCHTSFRLWLIFLQNQLPLLLKNIPLNSFLKLCKTQTGTLCGNVQKEWPIWRYDFWPTRIWHYRVQVLHTQINLQSTILV